MGMTFFTMTVENRIRPYLGWYVFP